MFSVDFRYENDKGDETYCGRPYHYDDLNEAKHAASQLCGASGNAVDIVDETGEVVYTDWGPSDDGWDDPDF